MISRSAIGRTAQLALRRQSCVQPANRRGLAAAASGSTEFSYETGDAAGIKVASRDVAGPTTKLAVVAKAGTRYQTLPGLTSGLELFAFKVCTLRTMDMELAWTFADHDMLSRTPREDLRCASPEKPSFLADN